MKNLLLITLLIGLGCAGLIDAMTYDKSERSLIHNVEEKIINCVRGSRKGRLCRRYTAKLQEMSRTRSKRSLGKTGGCQGLTDRNCYFMKLLQRFNLGGANGVVLNEISCSPFISPVRQRWNQHFSPQLNFEQTKVSPIWSEKSTVENNSLSVDATFKPSFITDVVGIDVIVKRSPPSQIQEAFARYRVSVHQLDNDGQELPIPLYHGFEFSCPTSDGSFMIIPLQQIDSLVTWFESDVVTRDDVRIRVRVVPEEQLFTNQRTDKIGVVENITCLSVLQNQKSHEGGSDMIQSQYQTPFPLSATVNRVKRSLEKGEPKTGCRKVSYNLNFQRYKDEWNVLFPSQYEIFECEGACEFPLKNRTNHAFAIKTDEVHNSQDRPREATVDCVPISYKTFHYFRENQHGVIDTAYTKDMIVDSCGCR